MLPRVVTAPGRKPPLHPAGGNRRALGSVGVNVDKADMQAGKGFAALHAEGVVDRPRAVGQMASVPADKGAGNLDILDRVTIAVAQRECDQGSRSQSAPAPELR